jgi:hypothetical protein
MKHTHTPMQRTSMHIPRMARRILVTRIRVPRVEVPVERSDASVNETHGAKARLRA